MAKREKLFNVRLTDRERKVLEAYAKHVGVSASEVIRDYVKSLERKLPKGSGEGTA